MRYDEIEPDFLSSEVGLVYIHELHYANGAIYKGQIKPLKKDDVQSGSFLTEEEEQGIRHGFGIQVWPDGAKYKGQWVENRAQGKGTFWHADGDLFEGEFKDDKSNGYGVYTCADKTKYEGMWTDDIQHG